MLDIEKFNYNYHNVGDYDMLMVIKEYLSDVYTTMEEHRYYYLFDLLRCVTSFNSCVVENEMHGVAKTSIYNMYHDLKDLLFLEVGIMYDSERDVFVLESEEE